MELRQAEKNGELSIVYALRKNSSDMFRIEMERS
jgi:hypothetical protein